MKLPPSYRNWLSAFGTVTALCGFLAFFVLQIISLIINENIVYLGLLTYIIIPGFIVLGLVAIPIGMYRKRKQIKKEGLPAQEGWPKIDLNDTATQNAITIFVVVSVVFVLLTVVGTWKAYHYSESVAFCGTLCHQVMEPEHTTYQNSPHARVKCVECHVGEGADWLVKSKISGLRQVFKTIAGSYPRPIPTPIENLRPARETCERCHWPEKFYAHKIRNEKHFIADSANTEWNIILKMKVGADHASLGNTSGSHWHINTDYEIDYVYDDDKRESIPWVRLINKVTGDVMVFVDEENPLPDSTVMTLPTRVMDCMDCHNRPSHNFLSPPIYVNNLLAANGHLQAIPWFKKSAMEALNDPYNTLDSAFLGIRETMLSWYSNEYPELLQQHNAEISNAVGLIQKAFALNAFPKMGVTYSNYPQHIGHMETKGCFRCHDDKHTTTDGRVISKDCNLCHTIIGQGTVSSFATSDINSGLEFTHPVDIGSDWKDYFCSDCHNTLFP